MGHGVPRGLPLIFDFLLTVAKISPIVRWGTLILVTLQTRLGCSGPCAIFSCKNSKCLLSCERKL